VLVFYGGQKGIGAKPQPADISYHITTTVSRALHYKKGRGVHDEGINHELHLCIKLGLTTDGELKMVRVR
jgi:hypothetical protein